jgi:hypothetical protein
MNAEGAASANILSLVGAESSRMISASSRCSVEFGGEGEAVHPRHRRAGWLEMDFRPRGRPHWRARTVRQGGGG